MQAGSQKSCVTAFCRRSLFDTEKYMCSSKLIKDDSGFKNTQLNLKNDAGEKLLSKFGGENYKIKGTARRRSSLSSSRSRQRISTQKRRSRSRKYSESSDGEDLEAGVVPRLLVAHGVKKKTKQNPTPRTRSRSTSSNSRRKTATTPKSRRMRTGQKEVAKKKSKRSTSRNRKRTRSAKHSKKRRSRSRSSGKKGKKKTKKTKKKKKYADDEEEEESEEEYESDESVALPGEICTNPSRGVLGEYDQLDPAAKKLDLELPPFFPAFPRPFPI